jgi:hypothetical protein
MPNDGSKSNDDRGEFRTYKSMKAAVAFEEGSPADHTITFENAHDSSEITWSMLDLN